MPSKITVLIADDHRLFAEALEAILSAEPVHVGSPEELKRELSEARAGRFP